MVWNQLAILLTWIRICIQSLEIWQSVLNWITVCKDALHGRDQETDPPAILQQLRSESNPGLQCHQRGWPVGRQAAPGQSCHIGFFWRWFKHLFKISSSTMSFRKLFNANHVVKYLKLVGLNENFYPLRIKNWCQCKHMPQTDQVRIFFLTYEVNCAYTKLWCYFI